MNLLLISSFFSTIIRNFSMKSFTLSLFLRLRLPSSLSTCFLNLPNFTILLLIFLPSSTPFMPYFIPSIHFPLSTPFFLLLSPIPLTFACYYSLPDFLLPTPAHWSFFYPLLLLSTILNLCFSPSSLHQFLYLSLGLMFIWFSSTSNTSILLFSLPLFFFFFFHSHIVLPRYSSSFFSFLCFSLFSFTLLRPCFSFFLDFVHIPLYSYAVLFKHISPLPSLFYAYTVFSVISQS